MAPSIEYRSARGRLILAATILASGMAFLDGSVVNVALPKIEQDLGGGFATLQWVMDAYLLTLGSLVLIGGALGDLLGRRRVFLVGIAGFAITSALCGAAPTAPVLVAARAAQGIAAALMVPASLAILSSVFAGEDRGRAIGLWSGLSGVSTALGPVIGGVLVDSGAAGWRWVFAINLPLAAAAGWAALRGIPDIPGNRTDAPLARQVDFAGGLLAVAGLGLIVGPLIEAARLGPAATVVGVLAGAGLLAAFVLLERRRSRTGRPAPMMPPSLFAIRAFAVANVQTFVVYGALGATLLLLTVALQLGLGWSALVAGAAGIPVTLILAVGSSRVGGLLPRLGSRPLLTAGPLVMAAGIGLLALLGPDSTYAWPVLPGLVIFAAGLTLVVAPITTTALSEIPALTAGVGSGINNAVARIAALMAIAAIPLAAGLDSASQGQELLDGCRTSQLLCAGLCLLGGAIAWLGYPASTGKAPAAP